MRHTEAGQRPVYAFRLADTERKLLEVAAEAKRETLAAYIRRVALAAARRELTEA